jgi:hypothetical protein
MPPAAAHLAHDDWPRVQAQAHGKLDAIVSLQAGIQRRHGVNDVQAGVGGSQRIVFMG